MTATRLLLLASMVLAAASAACAPTDNRPQHVQDGKFFLSPGTRASLEAQGATCAPDTNQAPVVCTWTDGTTTCNITYDSGNDTLTHFHCTMGMDTFDCVRHNAAQAFVCQWSYDSTCAEVYGLTGTYEDYYCGDALTNRLGQTPAPDSGTVTSTSSDAGVTPDSGTDLDATPTDTGVPVEADAGSPDAEMQPADLCANVTCPVTTTCHNPVACNPLNGQCEGGEAVANGTACDDGNACTQTDTCQDGTCTGNNPVICNAPDQCHSAGTCDPATGVCDNPVLPDGTACDDNNDCTTGDICTSGTCAGPGAQPSGTTCDDHDPCTRGGICIGNQCRPNILTASMTGANVVTQGQETTDRDATGVLTFTFSIQHLTNGNVNRVITMNGWIRNMDWPDRSHFHEEEPGFIGPNYIDYGPFGSSSAWVQSLMVFTNRVLANLNTFTEANFATLLNNPFGSYFNLHTGPFPWGANRGYMSPLWMCSDPTVPQMCVAQNRCLPDPVADTETPWIF